MWRYGSTGRYKEHFACFRCRKAYKQVPEADLPAHERPPPGGERVARCPQCRAPMADMGKDFEAPARSDVQRWKAVEMLHQRGIRLAGGPGLRLAELRDLDAFLAARGTGSRGEKLLRTIRQRMRRRRR